MQQKISVPNQRLKLIWVIELLKKFSDENHPLNAPDMIKLLDDRGIKCERKYIYKTLDTLSDYGLDINRTHHPKQGFYLGERTFEIAEIKILIDAVLSASFITPKKSKELVRKLENQLSVYQSKTLCGTTELTSEAKLRNEEIYYNTDTINDAIYHNKKIRFMYHHLTIKGNCITKDDGKEYTVSPYALIWCNDRYYLVCHCPKYSNISHFRVDRMKGVSILDEEACKCSEISEFKSNEEFNTPEYVKKNVDMFSGVYEQIDLICDNSILEKFIDKFGTDIKITSYSASQFKAHMEMSIGTPLIYWLLGYADKIYVQNPVSLRNIIKEKIKNLYNTYFSDEYFE